MRYLFFLSLILINASFLNAKSIMQIEVSGSIKVIVKIELFEKLSPNHVKQIINLVNNKKYDGVAFHRVIDGFMAQTGDVKFGNLFIGFSPSKVGMGGSDLENLMSEFSDVPFDRGIVGMARAQNPNSANSQFFIMLQDGHFLNGNYTVFGKVLSGMEVVDKIRKGDPNKNGVIVKDPDYMKEVKIIEN